MYKIRAGARARVCVGTTESGEVAPRAIVCEKSINSASDEVHCDWKTTHKLTWLLTVM